MPPDDADVLAALRDDSPVAWAVVGPDGACRMVSRAFTEATGLSAGAPAPPRAAVAGGAAEFEHADRLFDVWSHPLGPALLMILRERTDVARMEDQIWEQQARLSKAYADLSVRNQALSGALDQLKQREKEMSDLNRGLEEKVRQQLAQLERSHKLRRYLSPEIADSVLAGDSPGPATRKRILTAYFADLASFDELVAEMESEEVIEILNGYRHEMTGILFEFGGTLDKFHSARLMAFFGDPVPHEDHAARAVRAAMAMRERTRAMRRKWFPSATAVDLQVGIHTGYATVGTVGSEHRIDYTVIGKNVTLASALQQEAKPGQILISARTQELVKEGFDTEELQVVLKGSSRPVTAYHVQGLKGTAAPPEATGADATVVRSTAPVSGELVGRRLGPYVVQEKLGEGGMGIVYKALDERLQRIVALKTLAAELAADARFVTRFKREARALASLNSPHVAQIYFISDQEVPPFFAMEFVEGPTLRRVLTDQGRLPLRRSLDLTGQMAQGLKAAAEKGVVHRDIKPDNVMLTLKGQVKLTDFGLVKAGGGSAGMTSHGIVMGTPLYMSPEQARGEEVDLRTDIYSLGATLYHMLVGTPPFVGSSALAVLRKHEEEALPPHASLPGTVSLNVYQLIGRMMAKKREDRYADYDGLLQALESC